MAVETIPVMPQVGDRRFIATAAPLSAGPNCELNH